MAKKKNNCDFNFNTILLIAKARVTLSDEEWKNLKIAIVRRVPKK